MPCCQTPPSRRFPFTIMARRRQMNHRPSYSRLRITPAATRTYKASIPRSARGVRTTRLRRRKRPPSCLRSRRRAHALPTMDARTCCRQAPRRQRQAMQPSSQRRRSGALHRGARWAALRSRRPLPFGAFGGPAEAVTSRLPPPTRRQRALRRHAHHRKRRLRCRTLLFEAGAPGRRSCKNCGERDWRPRVAPPGAAGLAD
mmetsp:Transcript_25445/g.70937  ORF Transcript_25445/g.70937 Transcript_25445/m.70937 type:complete len:201 (+) Transcript_25445:2051-2653(+)